MARKGERVAGSGLQVAAFLFGLARGGTVVGAAHASGMKVATLYYRRKRCAVFAQAWRDALEQSDKLGADGRENESWAPACAGERDGADTVIREHGGMLMRKRKRQVEFDRKRKQAFLDHFAGTCNMDASAKAAGICIGSVHRALANDAAFAEGFEEALKVGYRLLEAEAVRQQQEAQKKYRISPKGNAADTQSFERTLQLLREYKRPGGGVGRRAARRGDARSRWTFDEAMAALEKKLKHFENSDRSNTSIRAEEAPPPASARSPSPPTGGEE